MHAFRVSTWEEGLAHFGKEGTLEGLWGWHEVLRRAEDGYWIFGKHFGAGVWPAYPGSVETCTTVALPWGMLENGASQFSRDEEGRILVGIGGHAEFARAFDHITRANPQGYTLVATRAQRRYYHGLTFDPGQVDWGGIGIDVVGIGDDPVTLGIGGRVMNGTQAARRRAQLASQGIGLVDVAYSFAQAGEQAAARV